MSRAADWTLREARDDDGPALIRVIEGVFREYPGCVLDLDGEMPDLLAMRTYWREHRGVAWVVEDDEGVLGCVATLPAEEGPGLELKRLYVDGRARGRGAGSGLTRRVAEEARERDLSFVELWTDTRFLDAHRLYEHLGYASDGRRRELHDLSGSVEVYYRLDL